MKHSKEFVARHIFNDEGFAIGSEFLSMIVRCRDCKHYQGECCVRFGRQEHPHRDPEDYCSKGEKK